MRGRTRRSRGPVRPSFIAHLANANPCRCVRAIELLTTSIHQEIAHKELRFSQYRQSFVVWTVISLRGLLLLKAIITDAGDTV